MTLVARWRLAVLSVVVATTIGAPAVQTQTPTLPGDLLTRPITPGLAALLVLDAKSPEAQRRLTEALRDARAPVRAVAARVATVSESTAQAATIIDVLSRETDATAASEQVRAVLALGGPGSDAALAAAFTRAGAPAALVMGEAFARSRGVETLTLLKPLVQASKDPASVADLVAVVAQDRPADRRRLAEGVVGVGDAPLWRAYLKALERQRLAVDAGAWLAGVASPDAAVRTETLLALAQQVEAKEPVTESVRSAVLPAGPWPPSAPTEVDFARELALRAFGRPASAIDWSPFVTSLKGRLPFGLWMRLTGAEQEAARRAGFGRGGRGAGEGEGYDPPAHSSMPTGRPARIARPLVSGLWAEMSSLTGCRFGSDADYAAARLTYHPDGRPREVSLVRRSFPKRCAAFVSAAMSLLVARPDHPLGSEPTDVVFIPLKASIATCIDQATIDTVVANVGDPGVTAPTLEHEEKPQYSDQARRAGVVGEVWVAAIVNERGCVAAAHVTRPLHPDLDLQALNAILQWRFGPGRLEGRPVPVNITVGVAFNLKR